MSKFYVGDDSVQRCRESRDARTPDTISGLPIEGGPARLFTGIVQAVDPNPTLGPNHGREWRITMRESKPAE